LPDQSELIADRVSALYETEEWTDLPLTREADTQTDAEPEERGLIA
jgi:hypothetical protein